MGWPNNYAEYTYDTNGNVVGLVNGTNNNAFQELTRKFALKKNNIATRVLCAANFPGGYSTAALVTGHTYHHAIALEAPFDAVRILLSNNLTSAITGVKCAISVVAEVQTAGALDNTKLNNSAGTWTNVTVASSSTITLDAGTATDASIVQSDLMQIRSLDRTDVVGALPILLVRVFMPKAGNATIPIIGNGIAGLTKWATIPTTATEPPAGRLYFSRRQDVDGVTTPASFTDTTAANANSMVYGVQYLCRGQVVQTMFIGDSNTQGSNSGLSIGNHTFATKAQQSVSTTAYPVECANLGWASQTTANFLTRAQRAIPIIKPDICFYSVFSPNDGVPTNTTVSNQLYYLAQFLSLCYTHNVIPAIFTGWPRTTDGTNAASSWTAGQDQFRIGLNALLLQYTDTLVIDASVLFGNGIYSGAVAELWGNASYTTDGLHISDTAHTTLGTVIANYLSAIK